MTTKFASNSFISRMSYKQNLNCNALRAMLVMLLFVLGIGNAWATGGGSTTYYSKATVAVKTGSGTVYVNNASPAKSGKSTTTSTAVAATNSTTTQNAEQEYYISAEPAADYRFGGWTLSGWSTTPSTSTATTSGKVKAASSTENNPSTGTAQATFLPISIASVEPTSVTLTPTDARTSCSDYTGSVAFTTTNDNAASQIGAPTFTNTGSGTWNATKDWAAGTSTVTYTFKGNGYYGGSGTSSGSRSNSATLTLPTAGGTSSKSVTFTANFPSLVLSDATENNKAYPINPTTDGTGTVVFPVQYCDGTFDFTATITGASGGTFTLRTISFTQTDAATGSGNITVPFTFNAGGAEGDFSATLTLTPQANTGGTAKSVTITAYAEAEATNDVSVTTAAGVTTEYATWAAGLAAANASAGSTLTLLRNIDLTGTYGITSTQGITQTFTLDLNGKILSGAINGSILNPNTKNKTLTIKDSKTGGKIQNITPDYNGVTYGINLSAACTLNLESGTIYAENQKQYSYGTSTVGGTASNATSVEVRAVRLVAGAKFNMSGGKVEAHGTRQVRAIYQESSAANSTEVNITGGEVYAEAPSYVYGIVAYGKVNLSGEAKVNVKINDELVNGNATYQSSKFDSYTMHRYGYGIYMTASANKTPSSCYFGTLTMTGGTVNVENINKTLNGTTLQTEHTYGIYMGIASTGMGNSNGAATDGTNTQKASAIGSVENATINVTHEGVQVYGVDVLGCYNSFNKTTTPFTIKNSTINVTGWQTVYGVLSDVSIDWSNSLTTFTGTGRCSAGNVELTNTTINATTTGGTGAYCAWASATYGTVADAKANTGAQSTGNATYKGEYAVAATLTINSGNYTANAATSSAYTVGSADRAKTIRNIRGSIISRDASTDSNGSLGGNAEAYPELYIHGGTFKAKTLSAGTARAVKSGGTTVIDGGTFEADAATSSSVAIAVHSGKTTVSGVTMTAYANTDANAVYVPATVSEYSLFDYAGEVELNNCVATVVTRTAENARGVYVNSTTRTYTLAQFNTAKEANNSTYKTYGDYWQVGTKAISGKATINGGSYTVKSATKNAYGVLLTTNALSTDGTAKADGEIIARNATFNVQTLNGATAYGIQAGGKATVDGCNLTVTASTSDARGVYSLDEKTIVKNSTITTTTSTSGSYGTIGSAVVASNGVERVADFELSGNTISSTAGTETAYAIYMTGASGGPYATDYFTGSMALAATAVVNSGTYSANASTKTAYAAGVADPLLKNEATATPTLIINGGKFKGTAGATPFADVSLAGEPGYFVLNGGYYVKDENLDKKLGKEMNKVAVKSGTPEYTEGYRWRVTDNMTGEYVCKIKENSTSYASLEEALQVVNATPNSTRTIIMIANYTLSKGDYVLPVNTTLLIPYQSTQTAINGATPKYTSPKKNVEQYEAPSPLYKLTFANGVNMSVYGKIEASAVTYLSNQGLTTHGTGVVSGKYGWLYLNEGSHIDLESGAALYAWGYVTGKGEINAKNGSAVYEDFQMGDWRGGTEESNVQGNTNGLDSKGVFLITHYYYQNIECPITYRAGAQGFAHGGTYMYNNSLWEIEEAVPTKEAVKMIGTSGAMFLMDPATAGEDTWVRKEYDTETDYVNWTMNSGAKLGSVSLKMDLPIVGNLDVSSSDYVLPITSNFNIIANDGEIQITNHVCFLPGSKLTIKKEGTLTIPTSQRVFFYDQDDWLSYGGYWFNPGYSPSWKVNPRVATIGDKTKVKMPDAEVLVEGLLNVRGAIYTTAGGANIHSTRENAGKVKFGAALPAATAAKGETTGNTTLYQWKANGPKYDGKALNPAWLKNEDGTYSKPTSSNTSAGDTWVYMQSLTEDTYEWTKASEDGCFTIRSTGDTKTYVHPSDWVAVSGANANHAYLSEDGTRVFVNTEAASTSASCKWWDVNPTPEVIDGVTYYVANNENFDNFGTYYYWDNTTSYWKPKKITVTWRNEDGTKITNGTYGDEYNFNTSPQFFGTNPKKTPTAIEKYDWIGWRDAEGNIYDKNATLPRATSDVTYTAYFNTTKYQYTITFKNNDNSDLWAGLVDAGTTGAELQALFETKYNEKTGNTVPQKAPTVDKVFTFTGWNTALATVTAAATYTAQYSESVRKYTVTFLNYNAVDELYTVDVNYNTRPTYNGVTPFRPNTSAFSYDWTGWQQGTTTYGTSETLPVVKGDISYIATFEQTELKYQVFFKRQDGSIIDAPFFTYEETPAAFPANPTMASTVSTDYTFREWSPATLVPVTEDGKVYTALFDESPRKYTAHFVNYNGTSLNEDQTIDYNTVPAYTGVTPTKPNDARNSYVFSGWAWAAGDGWEAGSVGVGETLPAIKGNITFTAQYTPTLLQFDVIYQREDGFVILRDKKKWGESSAFPTTFVGATGGLNYEDESYTYTFDHWSPATVVNPVITDATYIAYYNQSVKSYSISTIAITPTGYGTVSPASLAGIPSGSAVTVNGNQITVNGTTITATPAEATAQYTYTFSHWNNVPATVTGNISNVEAVFTRTVNSYTVTWKNADGTTLETDENVSYGTTPTYDGVTPTKAEDENYTYTFNGTWSPAITSVTGDATYTAQFSSAEKAHTYYYIDPTTGTETSVSSAATPANPADYDDEDYTYTFSEWQNDGSVYRAVYTSAERTYGDKLDIIDWTAEKIVINANGLKAVNGGTSWTVKYASNYNKNDRAADRTLEVARDKAHETANGYVVIKLQGTSGVESRQKYTVPLIYDANATLSGTTENSIVYVHTGATLTVNDNTTISELYVAPGASVNITGGKLTIGKLVLRTLPWQAASISGDFEATETWYTRIAPNKRTITDKQGSKLTYDAASYYQFALPLGCEVALKDVKVSNQANTPYGSTWLLKRYEEANRAAKGTSDDANWVALGENDNIQGGVGYELFSNSAYYREFYFPVDPSKAVKTIPVSYTSGGSAGVNHVGWNIVSSPLMSNYINTPVPEGMKVSWYLSDGTYHQDDAPDTIPAAIPFSYQASAGQSSISFADNSIVASAAPRRVVATDEPVRIQWLRLDLKDEAGRGDQTSILSHPTRYEESYKTGIDVAKQSLTASRALLYSTHAYGDMAFAGVSDSKLTNGIPLVVYSPKAQELTISMRENAWLNRLTAVWLIDHETGIRTDLLWSTYTFDAAEGTAKGRFTLMGEFKAPQVTTGVENGQSDQEPSTKARKVIIEDKIYIQLNGHMYDSTGKKVN